MALLWNIASNVQTSIGAAISRETVSTYEFCGPADLCRSCRPSASRTLH